MAFQGWPQVWAQWWRTPSSTAGSPPNHTGCCWQAGGAAPSRADPDSVLSLWHWPSASERSSLRHRQLRTVISSLVQTWRCPVLHTCVVGIKLLEGAHEIRLMYEQLFPQSAQSRPLCWAHTDNRTGREKDLFTAGCDRSHFIIRRVCFVTVSDVSHSAERV